MTTFTRVILLFILAGFAEIGGGWLVWQWLRLGRPWFWGVAGAAVLVLYGIIPTWQPETNFGRVYAVYGGIFVIMSLFWGWRVDGWLPDRYDLIGATVIMVGVGLILWAPR